MHCTFLDINRSILYITVNGLTIAGGRFPLCLWVCFPANWQSPVRMRTFDTQIKYHRCLALPIRQRICFTTYCVSFAVHFRCCHLLYCCVPHLLFVELKLSYCFLLSMYDNYGLYSEVLKALFRDLWKGCCVRQRHRRIPQFRTYYFWIGVISYAIGSGGH